MGSRKDFLSAMEAGKANAARDRNRGLHVGKVAKGWNRQRKVTRDDLAYRAATRTPSAIVAQWALERDAVIHKYRLFAYEPDFDWSNWS